MRREILEILVCPTCKSKLQFNGILEKRIRNATLKCISCSIKYEVIDEIPFLKNEDIDVDEHRNILEEINEEIISISKARMTEKEWEEFGKFKPLKEQLGEEIYNAMMKQQIALSESILNRRGIIVDVATGTGSSLPQLVNNLHKESLLIGVEIDPEQLKVARDMLNSKDSYDQVSLIVGNAKRLPLKDFCACAVLSHAGFYNIPNPTDALKESYRILSSDGLLGFTGMFLEVDSATYKIAERIGIGSLCTREGIEKTLYKSGFQLDDIKIFYSGIHPGNPRDALPIIGDQFTLVFIKARKK